jgi:RNA polymerase sigma-70 factor (ECF subfamily)
LSDDARQLVSRCLAGEQAAMVDFVDRYRGRVFGLCYRMLGQRQDAEDMAQETFVRALRSLARWDPERELEPWLLAIAGNRCRTMLASRSRRPQPTPLYDGVPDRTPDHLSAQHLDEEVQLALQGIRAEYRQAFTMFHESDLSYAEISEAMECPVGTVKTWIHRARTQLIEQLANRGVVWESRDAVRQV